ncbi:MAG: hypothetical protein STSR0008_02510 [Ignavibacterium sp.]
MIKKILIMKNIFLIILILFFITTITNSQTNNLNKKYEPILKYDPTRNPEEDLNKTIVEAKKTGKRILLEVGGDWCIWCHKLDKFFEENKDVKKFLDDHFILMKVNFSKENKNEKLLSNYPEIPGYPHIFVLDKNGKLLHSQNTGELESGDHHDREKMLAFLKRWSK